MLEQECIQEYSWESREAIAYKTSWIVFSKGSVMEGEGSGHHSKKKSFQPGS